VDQNLNNGQNDFLWSLLENPANDAGPGVHHLQGLISDFPQSGILQALLAHASEKKNLNRASVYFDPRALFKLINAPSTFTGVPDERMVIQPGISVNGSDNYPAASNENYAGEDLAADKNAPPAESIEEVHHLHQPEEELVAGHNAAEHPEVLQTESVNTVTEAPVEISGGNVAAFWEKPESVPNELAPGSDPEQTAALPVDKDEPFPVINLPEDPDAGLIAEIPIQEEIKPEPEVHDRNDAVEVFDEIVGIEEINLNQQPSGRYFSFDQEFGVHEDKGVEEKPNAPENIGVNSQSDADQRDVSKYYDEKMPYTFMWWLDKTRKEHAQAYQPYIKPPAAPQKKTKMITDELQQQYFENIFHITSVEELDKSVPPPPFAPDLKRKEQVIIDRFIKEEPQIKPQSSDKLDNENKAKKSSEDRDELVSETLASIYTDQMLYHKAIASYKKLMLKFPEKSRYFAEKIEQLEKKTN
jgi:hypothetical protein